MRDHSSLTQKSLLHLKRITLISTLTWTAIVALGMGWHIFEGYRNTLESASIQAAHSFEKDLVYRRWAAGHGGVYVPVTDEMLPNPYLAHIKRRDITSTNGLNLTLVNPAYMTRQVLEIGAEQYGHQGHITSLNPIRPANSPDQWEAEALKAFERGETEVSEVIQIEQTEFLRVMRPMIVEPSCLKCHAHQGYQIDDIRGGISVSVPMTRLWEILYHHLTVIILSYIFVWIGGLIGVNYARQRIKERIINHDQMEQEKEKLQSQLLHAQKLESVGQLAAGIAHEINTPAQFIGTNVDFLEEASQDITEFVNQIQKIAEKAPQETASAIEKALEDMDWEYLAEEMPLAITQSNEGVKRVTSIVQAMKEFSHPGSKEKESRNLNQIIKTTTTVARNEWKYVADMELKLASDLPKIPLLGDEMGQVILNMLVNAAHAIAQKLGDNPEGHKGTITITTQQFEKSIELRIRDTGQGIPKKFRNRVFDPFYTTKEVGKGTGQGLAISHAVIVDKHGGTIRFESSEGKGTCFVITLPRQSSTDPQR
ncbi:MAG: DUF3365 domain-containing protein [Desulfocapsa sp.]|nr:DUF3365 domain-containing protein [Desulfocapsa sp.]